MGAWTVSLANPTKWLVVLFCRSIPTVVAIGTQMRTNISSESATSWTLLLSSTLGNTNIGDFSWGSTYGSESSYTWSDYRIGYTGSQLQSIGMTGMRITTASGYAVEHYWTLSTSGFDNTCTSCNCGGNSLGSNYYWHGGRGGCYGSSHFGLKREADVHSACNAGGWEYGNAWGHFHRTHVNTGVYFFGDSCINENEWGERYYFWGALTLWQVRYRTRRAPQIFQLGGSMSRDGRLGTATRAPPEAGASGPLVATARAAVRAELGELAAALVGLERPDGHPATPRSRLMDSTRAIVRLWRQFAPASSEAQGGDGVIAADRVKEVLGGQLQNKVSALNGHSVDEVVQIYMQPDSTGVVGFLQFWRGMEEILRACGTQRSLLSPAQEDALAGFRRIRQCVLDWGAKEGVPTEQCTIQVEDLRYFIERSMGELGPDGQHFWRTRAEGLPVDEAVSGEEVAAALLVWLEHLLDEDDLEATNLDRTDMQSGRSRSSGSSSVDEPQFFEDDAISPVRSSARTAAPGLPPRSPDDSHSLLFSARTGTAQTPLTAAFAVGEGVRMEQQPPATPLGPPPRRSVQAPLRNSLGVDLRADSAAGRASLESRRPSSGGVGDLARRRAGTTPLEAALAAIVGRDDRRPASPTKAQAAEWREAIEFQAGASRPPPHPRERQSLPCRTCCTRGELPGMRSPSRGLGDANLALGS
ncbi:unnamed protein product [Prorocentrum cordatum]|uniref:Uncharacterized protein n=1 Tax=Prorocentrum cordatum TaxID=2364126 RepID=A0ABN9VZJ0_9DINO|nr:unnamed protein product [Polarella glacialis]